MGGEEGNRVGVKTFHIILQRKEVILKGGWELNSHLEIPGVAKEIQLGARSREEGLKKKLSRVSQKSGKLEVQKIGV